MVMKPIQKTYPLRKHRTEGANIQGRHMFDLIQLFKKWIIMGYTIPLIIPIIVTRATTPPSPVEELLNATPWPPQWWKEIRMLSSSEEDNTLNGSDTAGVDRVPWKLPLTMSNIQNLKKIEELYYKIKVADGEKEAWVQM